MNIKKGIYDVLNNNIEKYWDELEISYRAASCSSWKALISVVLILIIMKKSAVSFYSCLSASRLFLLSILKDNIWIYCPFLHILRGNSV